MVQDQEKFKWLHYLNKKMKVGKNMNVNRCFLKDQIDSLFDLLPVQLENSKKTIEENVHKEDFMVRQFGAVDLVG